MICFVVSVSQLLIIICTCANQRGGCPSDASGMLETPTYPARCTLLDRVCIVRSWNILGDDRWDIVFGFMGLVDFALAGGGFLLVLPTRVWDAGLAVLFTLEVSGHKLLSCSSHLFIQ